MKKSVCKTESRDLDLPNAKTDDVPTIIIIIIIIFEGVNKFATIEDKARAVIKKVRIGESRGSH